VRTRDRIPRADFERSVVERMGKSLEEIAEEMSLVIVPCDCNMERCTGWILDVDHTRFRERMARRKATESGVHTQ
jgi:hypothetical protein